MSSSRQDRPVVTLYPISQEDVNAYMAAIRLASSVRNIMDAQKASADREKVAMNANYDDHLLNALTPPPAPADPATPVGREPVPILNQTSSAQFPSNITKSALVHSPNKYPSINNSTDTVQTPTGATLNALELHQGRFPPPKPPIGSTPAPPIKSMARRTGPIPIYPDQGVLPNKSHTPGDIPAQCQLYVTNTDANLTFTVCPVTECNNNLTHDLASGQLHSGDAFSSNILAIRSTPMCEAPTGFSQRVACGHFYGWLVLGFFVLFSIMGLAWMKVRTHQTQRVDEENENEHENEHENENENENENATSPGLSHVSTNSSEPTLRGPVRKAHQEDRHAEEELWTEQYVSVNWRSALPPCWTSK